MDEPGSDLTGADALVMSAAVADYRPAEVSASKLKKQGERASIDLVKNPDLLAEIGAARAQRNAAAPVLVGFAVETGDRDAVVAYARRKRADKRVDFVVANEASVAFGADDNRATIVTADAAEDIPAMSKRALADVILDRVRARLASR